MQAQVGLDFNAFIFNLAPVIVATIAMGGAAVLMLLDNWAQHNEKASENIHKTFGDVEWITIFFFIWLFIVVVHGVEVGGLHALRLPDDAGVDRDLPRLCLLALFLSAFPSSGTDSTRNCRRSPSVYHSGARLNSLNPSGSHGDPQRLCNQSCSAALKGIAA